MQLSTFALVYGSTLNDALKSRGMSAQLFCLTGEVCYTMVHKESNYLRTADFIALSEANNYSRK